jgi:hypothetical protein
MTRVFRSTLSIEHDESRGLYLLAMPLRYGSTALYEHAALGPRLMAGEVAAFSELPQCGIDEHAYASQVVYCLETGLKSLA